MMSYGLELLLLPLIVVAFFTLLKFVMSDVFTNALDMALSPTKGWFRLKGGIYDDE